MNFYINQSIVINYIRIGGVTNSSVFQIGSAGIIKSVSNLHNTGGFTGPAPEAKPVTMAEAASVPPGPAIPLTFPSI